MRDILCPLFGKEVCSSDVRDHDMIELFSFTDDTSVGKTYLLIRYTAQGYSAVQFPNVFDLYLKQIQYVGTVTM